MAAFGLVQYFFGNGKFFWFYSRPYSDTLKVVKGSFTNANHFANFLALGLGPLIWWLEHYSSRLRRNKHSFLKPASGGLHIDEIKTYLLGLALVLVLFAGALSLSRGGMAAMLIASTIAVLACWRAISEGVHLLFSLLSIIVVIGAALFIFGLDRVQTRMETLSPYATKKVDWTGGRGEIWTTTL
ncbi:MAG: O-antigen ligase family protein, partial [Thermoguttaceae bacterium]